MTPYLDEDQDLLDELKTILKGIGDREPLPKEMLKVEMGATQIKSILRNRKTMVDLDQSNKKFTLVIIFFTIVQIFIAVMQFLLAMTDSVNKIFAYIVGAVLIIGIFLLSRHLDKVFNDQKNM